MDHMGPLPPTIRGNKYILVFIDHLTKYLEIIPARDRTASSAHIKIEQTIPDVSSSHKIYLKSQADWNGVLSDLSNINWSHFYRQLE